MLLKFQAHQELVKAWTEARIELGLDFCERDVGRGQASLVRGGGILPPLALYFGVVFQLQDGQIKVQGFKTSFIFIGLNTSFWFRSSFEG